LKILITGASGWLGRNSIRYFLRQGLNLEDLILIGSKQRQILLDNEISIKIHTFQDFPRLLGGNKLEGVVHLAYLTRDFAKNSLNEYINKNSLISDEIIKIFEYKPLWFTYVSSGAIYSNFENKVIEVDINKNPYGYLKMQDEINFQRICELNSINISIGRLWGASGIDFINAEKYALGEFVLNSINNRDIKINSSRKIFRKYCDSEQFMEICIKMAQTKAITVFNSNGDLIEIGELAKMIAQIVNKKIQIYRPTIDLNLDYDDYYPRDNEYFNIAKSLQLTPLSLEEQIQKTCTYLKSIK
jgi:nucleoside-diphosphate-sugar epimerase